MSKKKIIFLVFAAAFIISGVLFMVISGRSPVKVAYYRLNSDSAKILEAELGHVAESGSKKLPVARCDFSDPKCDFIFANLGKSSRKLMDKFSKSKRLPYYSGDFVNGGSVSASKIALDEDSGRAECIPLFFDVYEFLFDRLNLEVAGNPRVENWNEIDSYLEKAKKNTDFSLIFAGGDDRIFLGVISCLLEAFEGNLTYIDTAEKISSERDYGILLKKMCSKDGEFYVVARRLSRWMKKGVVKQDVLNMTSTDVCRLLENGHVGAVIMPLSQYRMVSSKKSLSLDTIPELSDERLPYFPAANAASISCVATVTAAIPVSDSKHSREILSRFMTSESQERLSWATGLSPYFANCRTPDVQADDGRFWIAATGKPLLPLGDLCFSDDGDRKRFVEEFKKILLKMM